ncbi:SSU ribosomal protein S1P [Melghiribacillus thermohalophilus]|uniref:SSU ribosomal protein S1P n=1 Tax=Melghiribacillus thermohalophilus TaxID=1324956 RepID=A0A4R3NAB0_9BACI|nr:30S ribosomal protein S1 [Melghiribacillus thermohalophilus]TCT25590.1 SSU ribosomal protein S1P [Melghiribacillus thermohalophilus]
MDDVKNDLNHAENLKVGDMIKGKVIKIEEKRALVDAGYKSEGILPISELSHLHVEQIADVISEGDELELMVKKLNDEEQELVLSKKAVDMEKAWSHLEDVYQKDETIEAEVKEVVKGGLVADVGLRGFIPASHVETYYVDDFEDYVGKTLTLKIIELDREQNRVILSHRAVEEAEMEKKKQDLLQNLEPGQIVEGVVQRIASFGVFVDIGGADGLVHISQLSHEHVEKASDVVNEGDKIKVKVLSVDRDTERISLSLKEALPGPWDGIEQKVKPGDVIEGTVKRLVNFGAFVEVFPGVEGLVHISQISSRHIGSPQEVLETGQTVKAKVLEVSEADKRISLSIREVEEEKDNQELQKFQQENEEGSFQIGDIIGEQLKKIKDEE